MKNIKNQGAALKKEEDHNRSYALFLHQLIHSACTI
jgi:hypothetical protein